MKENRYWILLLFSLTACLLCVDTTTGRLSFHVFSAALLTTFLIGLLTSCIPNKLFRNVIQIIVGECIICICLVDCYCQLVFGSPVSPQIISNILFSNLREMCEFISVFVGGNILRHWRLVILVFLCLLFPFTLTHKWNITVKLNKKLRIAEFTVLFICAIVEIPATKRYYSLFFNKHKTENIEGLIFRHYHEDKQTPLHRFAFACYALSKSSDDLAGIKHSTLSACIDGCSFTSPHIVLIIGESYNKHHSSLYGYRLPTATLQQIRMDKGELFLFNDAVTPWNITSNVFVNMFSLWENGKTGNIRYYPMFPILFRRAGYNVSFFSNQYNLKGLKKGSTNQMGHFFLADSKFSDLLFSFRNKRPGNFDMGLVNQVESFRKEKRNTDYSLDIIHLIGQHFDYSGRYPTDQSFFTTDDYSQKQLDDEVKQVVMHYDNATRYNDIVMDRILTMYEEEDAVVVFVSDHGEEVYDDLSVSGRLFQDPTALQAKNEYEVPMWIWCSDSYRNNHPDIVGAIRESTDKPFLTDGIPQILLYLAGIECAWTDESRNLLSDKYQCKPRIIDGDTDYDLLMGSGVKR